MITISEELLWLLVPGLIIFLILILIIRLKNHIRRTIKNEIYDHFPSIRVSIENFQRQVDFLKLEVTELERRLKELKK